MYPAVIEDYVAPRTLHDALQAFSRFPPGDAMCIAGGMSLMQAVKSRLVRPKCLIDLQHVAELKGVKVGTDGVAIGAMTRYVDLANAPTLHGAYQALNDAAAHVGDRQVRNRGTIGGSLCWNYLAACCPPVCIALGATLLLARADGGGAHANRVVSAEDFLMGPLETTRAPNEVLVAIKLPAAPKRAGSAYKKWGLVTDALPVIGVAVYVELDAGGRCLAARIAVGGLASGPRRAIEAEMALIGARGQDADKIAAAFIRASAETPVQSDIWADQDYRRFLIRDLGQQAAKTAFQRAQGG